MEVADGVAHINLSPGQRLELEYKAPWVVFIPGSLSPAPQPRRALWLWVVSMLVILGCIAGLIYDAAAGSMWRRAIGAVHRRTRLCDLAGS
jgi:hypothetical protein